MRLDCTCYNRSTCASRYRRPTSRLYLSLQASSLHLSLYAYISHPSSSVQPAPVDRRPTCTCRKASTQVKIGLLCAKFQTSASYGFLQLPTHKYSKSSLFITIDYVPLVRNNLLLEKTWPFMPLGRLNDLKRLRRKKDFVVCSLCIN